ncbi:hypothetical protein GCM10011335_49820 [Aureimonas glaciei]|uniref:Uncharacterized protein n=1 Tax=Aureimonas glaciei TaxID=1776957 RepID=A0A917DIF0_9HYPH|nr:hypothetical protein GCM10011335_49820 [Aureimonas glaciei]
MRRAIVEALQASRLPRKRPRRKVERRGARWHRVALSPRLRPHPTALTGRASSSDPGAGAGPRAPLTAPQPAKPRLRSSASVVGMRPRKAV